MTAATDADQAEPASASEATAEGESVTPSDSGNPSSSTSSEAKDTEQNDPASAASAAPAGKSPTKSQSTVSDTLSEALSDARNELEQQPLLLNTTADSSDPLGSAAAADMHAHTSASTDVEIDAEIDPNAGGNFGEEDSLPRPALVKAPTTPWAVALLLPLLCLATHALFYYGQTVVMWKLRAFADIDVWANATSNTAKGAFYAAGVDYDQHVTFQQDKDMNTFTYWFAIQELWEAKKMPSKTLPRFGAAILVMFSGIWPHLKLILLNLTFLCFRGGRGRTRLLSTLSTLGKWSLADVLVVCVMVGVLHLNWIVDPAAIKKGVIADLPEILSIVHSQYTTGQVCDYLLHWECAKQRKIVRKTKCDACLTFVHKVFNDPHWAQKTGRSIARGVETSGGGLATLRVEGMVGIYAFCGAVIISILLSIIVDWYDHKADLDTLRRQHVSRTLLGFLDNHALSLQEPLVQMEDGNAHHGQPNSRMTPLDMDAGDDSEHNTPRQRRSKRRREYQRLQSRQRRQQQEQGQPGTSDPDTSYLFSIVFMIAAAATAYLMYLAVQLPSMGREVKGAAPKLLHDVLGLDLGLKYSLHSLMETTGAAGGWDNLLMSTFSLFCVLGPLVRSALCATVGIVDKLPYVRDTAVIPMTTAINFLGAFCAWEVFIVAIVMVDILMPTITDTIIHSPICDEISENGSCLKVEFNILTDTFRWIVAGGFLLILVASAAAKAGNQRQRAKYMPRMEPQPDIVEAQYTLLDQ